MTDHKTEWHWRLTQHLTYLIQPHEYKLTMIYKTC